MKEDGSRGGAPLSVSRVLQILKVLSLADEPLSLAELGRQLSAPKTSLIGLLRGLVDLNFVTFSEGTYRLGGASFELAGAMIGARQRLHMGDYIREGMLDLNTRSGETVLYSVLDNDEPRTMSYISIIESRGAIRISVGIGDRSPLYCTAGGRILLAGMSDEEVDRYLRTTPLNAINSSTETDPQAIRAAVMEARAKLFACVGDEVIEGVTGMAAPVRDSAGTTLGALIIAGPSARMQKDSAKLESIVREEAQSISLSLGHHGGPAAEV